MLYRSIFVSLVLIISFSACNGGDSSNEYIDAELRLLIAERALTGDPAAGRDLPDITSPEAQLGMKLFFSKSLGGDRDSACVSCHHPFMGFGDNLPLPIGVGAKNPDLLGPGRTHPEGDFTVERNAPTTINLGLWDSVLFWDGRAESIGKTSGMNGGDGTGVRTPDSAFGTPDPLGGANLTTAQARFPMTSTVEMRGFDFVSGGSNHELRVALEQRLSADENWQSEFRSVYGGAGVSFDRIAAALSEYERSQVFVETPWKEYVEGETGAISLAAKRGALLFFKSVEQGGADCASCHSGDFFTDEKFYATLAPQIGRGKGDWQTGTHDFGRERETGERADRYAFRTPSLLNVSITGPYTHAGAYATLAEVIEHHLAPVDSLAAYNFVNAAQADMDDYVANTEKMLADATEDSSGVIDTFETPISLGDNEIQDLVAFLESLTDSCVQDRVCLSQWIPQAEDDVDGTQLKAEFTAIQ
jgi:cytochrome c peroxidase